jgi:hypothetical protein
MWGVDLAEPSDFNIQNNTHQKDAETSTSIVSSNQKPEIRMRCPGCFKLYAVDPLTIYVEKPEFDCVSCDQKFWISFPEALEHSEIVAFPIEWSEQYKGELELEQSLAIEPQESLNPELVEKISKNYSENFSEVIKDPTPEKTSGIRKVGFVDDINSELNSEFWFLEKSWDRVLNNYDDKSIHKEFILSARAKQSLDFALGKYKNFCEANSHDTIAKEMKGYCEKLIQDFAIHKSVLGNEQKGVKKYFKYLPWIVLSLSAGLIGLGFSNEGLSDLAGFGFALIFLTGALSLLKESNL